MNFKLLLCSAAVGLLALSCVDDGYDLDNINTTSRVYVNDLVIPVNLGEVYLSDVIDLDDESDIKVVEINGQKFYAVQRSGSFDSDPIYIAQPHAKAPALEAKQAALVGSEGVYDVPAEGNDFTFTCDDVDASIIEITGVKMNNLTFAITFNTPALASGTYDNVKLQLPKGMTGTANNGSYDASTGVWTLSNLAINSGVAKAVFTATAITFDSSDFSFKTPRFEFSSNFSVLEGGYLKAATDAPAVVEFTVDFDLGELDVTAVTGKIKYEIEGMDIDPINLGDLPDFLQGDETNISLANPMICLQTSNPVASDKLTFTAGLSLTANREDEAPKTYTSNVFTIGYNYGVDGPYNTILSPERITDAALIPETYRQNFVWTEFPGLGSLLAGNGLPETIGVTVNNPQIPEQTVTDYALGRNIPGVVGSYDLFAPLALQPNSTIIYTDTKDGWNEDVEDLYIDKLVISALGTNNTPLNAVVKIIPINVEGQPIPNVVITPIELSAGAVDESVKFEITGAITKFDGIIIEATVTSANDNALSPDQTLSFKDIRVKVNGYYQREL